MSAYEQWPVERYIEVAATLIDGGHVVVLTGSSAPRDRGIVDSVVDAIDAWRVVAVARATLHQGRSASAASSA